MWWWSKAQTQGSFSQKFQDEPRVCGLSWALLIMDWLCYQKGYTIGAYIWVHPLYPSHQKWQGGRNEIFGWISPKWPGFTVPALTYPYFIRRISIVASMGSYQVSKVTIQGFRNRITITINMMPMINILIFQGEILQFTRRIKIGILWWRWLQQAPETMYVQHQEVQMRHIKFHWHQCILTGYFFSVKLKEKVK